MISGPDCIKRLKELVAQAQQVIDAGHELGLAEDPDIRNQDGLLYWAGSTLTLSVKLHGTLSKKT